MATIRFASSTKSALKHLGADRERRTNTCRPSRRNSQASCAFGGNETRGVNEPGVTFTSADGSTSIQPHFAPLGGGRHSGVVIFLEDTSLIADRVQQAKLAALGRLSASIAHEIRNPIGAMSHAGQLLAESPSIGADEQRLTDIIRVNARRVSQIVESVLALSQRDKTRPERLQLNPWLE